MFESKFPCTEARHIALTRALRPLTDSALENPAARASAYAAAGLGLADSREDREALHRQRRAWRRAKPAIVAAMVDFAASRAHRKLVSSDEVSR